MNTPHTASAPQPVARLLAQLPWSRAALVTLAVAGVGALLTAPLDSAEVWSALTPGVCAEYCEASTNCGPLASRAAIQQPLNAWSNLAYLFVGVLALRRPLRPSAALFSASCALLAIGSFLFHAAVTTEFQWLDMVGTYAVLIAVAARGCIAVFGVAERSAVGAALAADLFFAVFKWRINAFVALPVLIAALSVPMALLVKAGRIATPTALLPLLLMGAAFALRQIDVAHIGCLPDSRFYQGHALWHLLTAASLGLAYFCFDAARAEAVA